MHFVACAGAPYAASYFADQVGTHIGTEKPILKGWRLGKNLLFPFFFSGPHPRHMEFPRLGVELELQPLAYARATAMLYPSDIFNLHHSPWQCWPMQE